MKTILFLTFVIAGQQPQTYPTEVASLEVCWEQAPALAEKGRQMMLEDEHVLMIDVSCATARVAPERKS